VLGASVHIVSHGLITKQVVFDPSIRRTNSGFGVPLHIGRYRPRQALAQWTNVAAQPCAHQRECEFSNFQAHRPMELLLASREVAVAMRATATLTLVGLITPSGDAVTAQRSVHDTTSNLEIYGVDRADLISNIGTQWFNGGEVVVSWNPAG